MAPSDRDLAQQWLAERICANRPECRRDCKTRPCPGCVALVRAAILDTPGVEVDKELLISAGKGWGYLRDDGNPTHTQLVIRLPVEPIAQRSGVAAHQHTEKINEEKP